MTRSIAPDFLYFSSSQPVSKTRNAIKKAASVLRVTVPQAWWRSRMGVKAMDASVVLQIVSIASLNHHHLDDGDYLLTLPYYKLKGNRSPEKGCKCVLERTHAPTTLLPIIYHQYIQGQHQHCRYHISSADSPPPEQITTNSILL